MQDAPWTGLKCSAHSCTQGNKKKLWKTRNDGWEVWGMQQGNLAKLRRFLTWCLTARNLQQPLANQLGNTHCSLATSVYREGVVCVLRSVWVRPKLPPFACIFSIFSYKSLTVTQLDNVQCELKMEKFQREASILQKRQLLFWRQTFSISGLSHFSQFHGAWESRCL